MAACVHRREGFNSLKILSVFFSVLTVSGAVYVVDNVAGLGRPFDGIGGLSGGATSKLLVNYAEPYRSQILDYLFKPNFGASLHILKVEIGGDVQSTDGTESSHQHEEYEENYKRGYEWWLMLEAKKRNPDIKLYGLPWGFPGWVGNGTSNPYVIPQRTANYITRWVNAAKKIYGLDMDYIGIWNERNYDTTYIKVLRTTLDAAGYNNTRIVAADGGWGIANDVLKDPQLRAAVDILGVHYPGTLSSAQAVSTGLRLWSSEDYSTFNDNVGAGCWARILNQNYVNGNMTSTISWNLIASYYQNLPFGRDALMTAMEPWSGHYVVESPIWVTAHTTQFANTTWRYLRHGYGSGKLDKGGSYVSLTGPSGEFSMVIETMTHNHSLCIRPGLPAYNVVPQLATFQLKGALAKLTQLNVWFSKLGYNGQVSELFSKRAPVAVTNGAFSLTLDTDLMYTLTSLTTGAKGAYSQPPPPKPFPLPYSDNYENYYEFQEAYNFAPQMGVWEVRKTTDPKHRQVNRQVILHTPVRSCPKDYFTMNNVTVNIGGNINWRDVSVQADVFIPSVNGSSGAFIGARVNKGGCYIATTGGLFFSVSIATGKYMLSLDTAGKQVVVKGDSPVPIQKDTWYTLTLIVNGDNAQGYIDTHEVFFVIVRSTSSSGFVAMGTTHWGYADFDNLLIRQVVNGELSVMLDIDVIYTLTTVQTGMKGAVSQPPPTKPFPLPYFDNYENYNEFQEAANFAPQEGVWEVRKTLDPLHRQVNRQVVLHTPVKWCNQDTNAPTNMGGNFNWTDVSVQADVFVPSVNGSSGAFIGARVNKGGCGLGSAQGLFFSVSIATGKFMLSSDTAATKVVVKGDSPVPLKNDTWYQLTLIVRGDNVLGFINMDKAFFVVVRSTSSNGFAAMGTKSWGYTDFDNFLVRQAD